jgi:endoglucanase
MTLRTLFFAPLLLFGLRSTGTDSTTATQPLARISVVDSLGLIHVKGNMIVDKHNNPVALHGMSFFWSQWGGNFYNDSCVRWLRDDWKCTIVRAACGVEEGGYLTNPDSELAKVSTVIESALKLGIYVVVDWHDHHADRHLEQSKEFFRIIARRYGSSPNIIYEVFNEPQRISWGRTVKPYTEAIIDVIRQYDPDNLIVAGTTKWSQDVDSAALDPIKDVNLAYSLHFYSSTHKQPLRDKAKTAMNNGAALFVTEYGISEANGNGIIDSVETARWLDFVDAYKLSTCNWSLFDKNETSAALKPGANPTGNWNDTDLSTSGMFIRTRIRQLNDHLFRSLGAAGE